MTLFSSPNTNSYEQPNWLLLIKNLTQLQFFILLFFSRMYE